MSRQAVDLEPIDRLEEKVRLLVGMIDRLRAEQARTLEENQRLAREMDALRARIADAQGASAEVESLREERELIRSRVVEMLQRIEALNL
ncbi:MAG TPA: cell division protein ZapB [Vicinamibacterales bacterium]|jgi:regulator of replication initiation timing|nr:cell division protein ZapB [Vicinamibacterales bacterium]